MVVMPKLTGAGRLRYLPVVPDLSNLRAPPRSDEGYTTEASILKAIGTQSTTITAAGVIMAIAFSSLLLSDTYVLNEFGFVLVCASVVDTLIIRTLFVPALMFLVVVSNWWPGKMSPAVHKSVHEIDGLAEMVQSCPQKGRH